MHRILAYTILLLAGMMGSQLLPIFVQGEAYYKLIGLFETNSTVLVAFIMIHVGFEFNTGREKLKQYWDDYMIAVLAALLPWLSVAAYLVSAGNPSEFWSYVNWRESFILARFAAPTSAGILFGMLTKARLKGTWVYQKLRVLAIDIDSLLIMIPIKVMAWSEGWQLSATVLFIFGMLYIIWRFQDTVLLPATWGWVFLYSIALTGIVRYIYQATWFFDSQAPLMLEILLPAYAMGAVMQPPAGRVAIGESGGHGHDHGFPVSDRMFAVMAAALMLFVGLSLPPVYDRSGVEVAREHRAQAVSQVVASLLRQEPVTLFAHRGGELQPQLPGEVHAEPPVSRLNVQLPPLFPSWREVLRHVLIITLLAVLGKMLPVLLMRQQAHWREKLALALGMVPRVEEGAALFVISLKYGVSGPMLPVVLLALMVNVVMVAGIVPLIRWLLVSADVVRSGYESTTPHPQLRTLGWLRDRKRDKVG